MATKEAITANAVARWIEGNRGSPMTTTLSQASPGVGVLTPAHLPEHLQMEAGLTPVGRAAASCAPLETAFGLVKPLGDAPGLSGAALRRFSGLALAAKAGGLPAAPSGGIFLSQGITTDDPAGMVLSAWGHLGRLYHCRRDLRMELAAWERMAGASARQSEKISRRRLETVTQAALRLVVHLDAVLAWWKEVGGETT